MQGECLTPTALNGVPITLTGPALKRQRERDKRSHFALPPFRSIGTHPNRRHLDIICHHQHLMALWCLPPGIRRRAKKATRPYPSHGQLWSSSMIEDHPSAPEAVEGSSQYQSQHEASAMRTSQGLSRMLQDPSELISLARTEWFESPGECYTKDRWFGGQFLLYYETEKMAAQYQDLRGAGCMCTHKEALDEYPYSEFCQRLGLLNPSIWETAICSDPQLTARKLFEAFIGIARRQSPDQYSGYYDMKQWLSDLESYTHPQVDINEKEVFTPSHQISPGSRIKLSESGTEDLSSKGVSDTFNPPRLPILTQSVPPAEYVMAQLSPATSGAVSPMPAEPSSIVPAVPNRQMELQELSLYTSCLKQYGMKKKVDVQYEEKRELPNFPPRFYCKVIVSAFSGEGRGSSKKEAQHRASKALQITFPEPFHDTQV